MLNLIQKTMMFFEFEKNMNELLLDLKKDYQKILFPIDG